MSLKDLIMKFIILMFFSSCLFGNNLRLIATESNGFAIYRSGKPKAKDMSELCNKNIEEMMVLSGTADEHEFKYQEYCPTLKVTFNKASSARVALTDSFLKEFDTWVEDAKRKGKKIAFRCECGCHRTGRLAAYYQMKYQGITSTDAIAIMNKHGKYMFIHPQLPPQVRALENFIKNEPCSEKQKHCVQATL